MLGFVVGFLVGGVAVLIIMSLLFMAGNEPY
jgi:hypothetical protein